jgi:hypothetical protein
LSSDLATLSKAIAENVIELDQHPSAASSEPNGEQISVALTNAKARGYNVN